MPRQFVLTCSFAPCNDTLGTSQAVFVSQVESYLETGTRDDRIYNGIASMLSKWPQEHASAASAAS